MTEKNLTHIDQAGMAHMVDVTEKSPTLRIAIGKGSIRMLPGTLEKVISGNMKKGDVLSAARLAGIMAAKKTSELIPLCHNIFLNQVVVDLEIDRDLPGVQIRSEVRTYGVTGVEMEALTAVSIAALTVYDMIKAVQKDAVIGNIRLVEKHGGKSGDIINE